MITFITEKPLQVLQWGYTSPGENFFNIALGYTFAELEE